MRENTTLVKRLRKRLIKGGDIMQTYNIGIIGAGAFSVLHAEAIRQCKGAVLHGLWNRSDNNKLEKAKLFGCKAYSTAEELVNDPMIDIVLVLTNLESHVQYAKLAINAGKHCFIEKPVALHANEVLEIQELAKKKGVVCVPGHNMIHEEGIMRIKDMISSGRLGKVISIYVLYNMLHTEEIAARYPGVVRQIFTHNLYTLFYLGGLPVEVSAMKTMLHYEKLTQEDFAIANLKMKSGALGHISANFAADDMSSDPWTFLVKVIGTNGSARYTYQDWVELGHDNFHTYTYSAYQGSVNNQTRHLIETIRDGVEPISGLTEAYHAQLTLEAIEKSIEEKRHVSLEL